MIYTVEITKHPARDGRFTACCRETGAEITSRDPEHDICDETKRGNWIDNPIEFWYNGVKTLTHSSMYKMAARRIELGEKFPYIRPERKIFKNPEVG